MREILFRGKSKNSGRWVYGDLITQRYNSRQGIHIYEKNDKLQSGYQFVRIDKNTIGQYTGLTDKNGKKIFEGDIVKFKNQIFRVVFEGGTFGIGSNNEVDYSNFDGIWICNDYYISLYEIYSNYNISYDDDMPLEVIGNIYNNPELLEA